MATPFHSTSKAGQRYNIRSTPQTLTLGAGDNDFVELNHSSNDTANDEEDAATPPALGLSWFPQRSSRPRLTDTLQDDDRHSRKGKRHFNSYCQVEMQEKRQGLLSLDQNDPSMPSPSLSLEATNTTTTTFTNSSIIHPLSSTISSTGSSDDAHLEDSASGREEQLQHDCSFFYRRLDHAAAQAQQARQSSSRFRAVLSDSYQSLFHYRDAVDVLSPPVLSHYRARYRQLNQEIPTTADQRTNARQRHDTIHSNDYDLQLTSHNDMDHESSHNNCNSTQQSNMITNSVQLSSLLYQHKGRILLRLPQENVRLVMDQDLPVGKLSVCQWRRPLPDETALFDTDHHDLESPCDQRQQRPSLHYVLTVPDDLYRKVVGDMSQAVRHPFCNMGRCCNDDDHVDIGVAVVIVAVFMILLLVVGAAFGDS